MAGSGKHPHDSGRARAARFRDRSQLEFDDFLVEDFLEKDCEPCDDAIDRVPVRFDNNKLATHLSDSAIASAMLDSGVFEENLHDDSISLGSDLDFALFALLSESEQGAKSQVNKNPASSAEQKTKGAQVAAQPAPVIRPGREYAAKAGATGSESSGTVQEFSIRGFAQGFATGAVAGGAALLLLRMIF